MHLNPLSAPTVPIGKIKSFGVFGPKYEIGQLVRRLDEGDWLVSIELVETGEEAEYRFTHILDVPEAV